MANFISKWWQGRRERYYRKRRWHLAIEIFLIAVILSLLGIVLYLPTYQYPVWIDGLNPQSTGTPVIIMPKFEASATLADPSVSASDRIEWTLKLSNTGVNQIERLEIFLPEGEMFSDIKTEGAQLSADKIVVQPLEPKAAKEIKISLICKDCNSRRSLGSEAEIIAFAGSSTSSRMLSLPEVRFESELNVSAKAYYHSPQGDQLGIGPVPPVAGIPTTYWLILKAENEGNRLEDFALNFRLPRRVELSGEQSLLAGKYSYDKDNRRVIWQIDSLEASGGRYIANFGLVLIPSTSQVGKIATLAEDIRYNGHDAWTGESFSGKLSGVDTDLPDDPINSGSGKVIAQ